MEAALGPRQFVKINRSALVNVDEVAELRLISRGKYEVVLRDGSRLSTRRPLRDLEGPLSFSSRPASLEPSGLACAVEMTAGVDAEAAA